MNDFRNHYDWSDVLNPITDEEATTWVANLRSGEYLQAEGALKVLEYSYTSPGGHEYTRKYIKPHLCCLGVLGEQCSFEARPDAGLLSDDEFNFSKLPEDLQNFLAGLNDGGKSFKYIATYIEKGFGLKKKKESN